MEWIITCKVTGDEGYRVFDAFEEFSEIDWHKSVVTKNIVEGDIVYIYVGVPYSKIMLKTICTKSLIKGIDVIQDDSKYYNNLEKWGDLRSAEYFRIKFISMIDDDKLSKNTLNDLNLVKTNIQGSFKSENHPQLFEYVKNQFDDMNKTQRLLFCNVAYMKNYDALAFDEIPVNGGSYVAETKDAYEKYNFHVCEDGMIRGFVETKYSDGALGGQHKPKQLRIENIDSDYKKEDVIDNVLVVFCAHSPKIGKTVIVGWYKNAQVYRGREHYNGRQFNIMTNYKNAVLLNESNRTMEVPRATQHENNLGFGQANVWYANKPEHQEYVKRVIEYIETEGEKVSRRDNNIKNTLEDERLNNNLKSVTFDKNYHFEYTDEIVSKPVAYETKKGVIYYKRDRKRAINALSHADYMCEYNNNHESFIRKNDGVRYTEAHHLIPMSQQDRFGVSLDVEENIVSLCSNCHNEIHYGKNAKELIEKLYNEREEYLKNKGIYVSLDELLSYYNEIN